MASVRTKIRQASHFPERTVKEPQPGGRGIHGAQTPKIVPQICVGFVHFCWGFFEPDFRSRQRPLTVQALESYARASTRSRQFIMAFAPLSPRSTPRGTPTRGTPRPSTVGYSRPSLEGYTEEEMVAEAQRATRVWIEPRLCTCSLLIPLMWRVRLRSDLLLHSSPRPQQTAPHHEGCAQQARPRRHVQHT